MNILEPVFQVSILSPNLYLSIGSFLPISEASLRKKYKKQFSEINYWKSVFCANINILKRNYVIVIHFSLVSENSKSVSCKCPYGSTT